MTSISDGIILSIELALKQSAIYSIRHIIILMSNKDKVQLGNDQSSF
jgi:hypothetical protein